MSCSTLTISYTYGRFARIRSAPDLSFHLRQGIVSIDGAPPRAFYAQLKEYSQREISGGFPPKKKHEMNLW